MSRSLHESWVTSVQELYNAISSLDMPEDYKRISFKAALEGLQAVGMPSALDVPLGTPNRQHVESKEDADLLAKVAHRSSLEVRVVADVVRADQGVLSLILPSRLLPNSMAAATRDLALLVAGVRQAAELEEWTPLNAIADVCRDYNVYDSKNFASTVTSMTDCFRVSGSGKSRSVRLTVPGWERWSEKMGTYGKTQEQGELA